MPFWHFKYSCSSFVNWNIKSVGNLSIFLFTCRFICDTSTWYSWDKSLSSITCFPLIVKILSSIFSLAFFNVHSVVCYNVSWTALRKIREVCGKLGCSIGPTGLHLGPFDLATYSANSCSISSSQSQRFSSPTCLTMLRLIQRMSWMPIWLNVPLISEPSIEFPKVLS